MPDDAILADDVLERQLSALEGREFEVLPEVVSQLKTITESMRDTYYSAQKANQRFAEIRRKAEAAIKRSEALLESAD